MKKFLLVLTFAFGTCLAVNAQDVQKSDETAPTNTNVQVQSGGQSVQGSSTHSHEGSSSEAKSCCSSKKGKDSAKNGKSCCADGKKSAAHCSDKKDKAEADIKKDNE